MWYSCYSIKEGAGICLIYWYTFYTFPYWYLLTNFFLQYSSESYTILKKFQKKAIFANFLEIPTDLISKPKVVYLVFFNGCYASDLYILTKICRPSVIKLHFYLEILFSWVIESLFQ